MPTVQDELKGQLAVSAFFGCLATINVIVFVSLTKTICMPIEPLPLWYEVRCEREKEL